MPYNTDVTITAKTKNVDKTIKQLETVEKKVDEINKKSLAPKSDKRNLSKPTGLPDLSTQSLEDLQALLRNLKGAGLEKYRPDVLEAIAAKTTVSPDIAEEVATAVSKSAGSILSKINWKAIGGGLLGLRSAYYFIKQIAARNENLTASVQYFMDAVASFLEPILDWIAGMIASIAKHLAGISKGVKTTAKAAARQLASFDEINNLTTKEGSGGRKKSSGEDFIDGLLELLKGLLEFIGGLIAAIYYGPIMLVQTGLAGIVTIVGGVFAFISGLISGVVSAVAGFIEGFISGFRRAREEGHSILVSIIPAIGTAVINAVNRFVSGFKNAFTAVLSWVENKIFNPIKNSITNIYNKAFKPALQMILNGLGKIVNGFVGMVNSVISVLNKIPGINLGYLNRWNVPQLAGGGMVDRGQLFVANENGAEMIGSFGNKTAVANNEQIIEGIKRGVEEAMQNSNQTIQLVVDGTVLSSVVINNIRKQNRIMGRSVI